MHVLSVNKVGALGLVLTDAMAQAITPHSISAAAVLLTLRDRGSMTPTQLADVAGITQPTATRVASRLVRLGFVQRSVRDGRAAPLRLTPAGRRQAQGLQRSRLAALERLINVLPETERRAFERAVDTLLDHVTVSRAFARTTCRLCDHSVCTGHRCPVGVKAKTLEGS
jgi:DNA-binding MarR family transcriptional regulator